MVTSAKKKLEPEDVAHIANTISHSPEILIAEEQKIAGIRGTVSLFDNEIPELWEEYLRFHKKYLKTAGAGYSICKDEADYLHERWKYIIFSYHRQPGRSF